MHPAMIESHNGLVNARADLELAETAYKKAVKEYWAAVEKARGEPCHKGPDGCHDWADGECKHCELDAGIDGDES